MVGKVKRKKKKPTKKEMVGKVLNPRQEKFCRNYVQNSSMFGNATISYADAYDYDLDSLNKNAQYEEIFDEENDEPKKEKVGDSEYTKQYNVCSVEGNRLLRNPKINKRITELLNELANDEYVDGELLRIVAQNEDLSAKRQAISEYNKVKQRITNKVKIEGLSLKELYDSANDNGS